MDYGNTKGMAKKGWTLSSGIFAVFLDFFFIFQKMGIDFGWKLQDQYVIDPHY